MKLEPSRQIVEKCNNMKFHDNPSTGSQVVPCGSTDGHDEATETVYSAVRTGYLNKTVHASTLKG